VRTKSLSAAALMLVLSAGCAHVPPSNMTKDRFDYAEAVAESWKRQTLLNVVHIRYADAPVFLDLTSVINTYTRSNTLNASATVPESPGANSVGAGASGTWSNSPTVTYQPVTGDRFARQLLRPIPPASLLQMMEAGWPAQLLFPVAVRSVNGITGQTGGRQAEPDFDRLVQALTAIQSSEGIGFRVSSAKPGEPVLLVISREDRSAAVREQAETVRKLLGLEPGVSELEVAFGSVPRSKHELAMVTRSMVEIMLELGTGIDVPAAHMEDKRVLPMRGLETGPKATPLIHILSGKKAPSDAYAAIHYRDYDFWIDDRDVPSKRLFTFLMILFSLAESGQPSAAPLLTISK